MTIDLQYENSPDNYNPFENVQTYHVAYTHDITINLREMMLEGTDIDDIEQVAYQIDKLFLTEFICSCTPKSEYPKCRNMSFNGHNKMIGGCPIHHLLNKINLSPISNTYEKMKNKRQKNNLDEFLMRVFGGA